MALVECLEVIDIDHQDRQWPAVALSPCPFQTQHLIQTAAVGQAGEAVSRGQGGQALLGIMPAT
ncbi:hypothetical protein D3C76_1850480 [compost metagenome]